MMCRDFRHLFSESRLPKIPTDGSFCCISWIYSVPSFTIRIASGVIVLLSFWDLCPSCRYGRLCFGVCITRRWYLSLDWYKYGVLITLRSCNNQSNTQEQTYRGMMMPIVLNILNILLLTFILVQARIKIFITRASLECFVCVCLCVFSFELVCGQRQLLVRVLMWVKSEWGTEGGRGSEGEGERGSACVRPDDENKKERTRVHHVFFFSHKHVPMIFFFFPMHVPELYSLGLSKDRFPKCSWQRPLLKAVQATSLFPIVFLILNRF